MIMLIQLNEIIVQAIVNSSKFTRTKNNLLDICVLEKSSSERQNKFGQILSIF